MRCYYIFKSFIKFCLGILRTQAKERTSAKLQILLTDCPKEMWELRNKGPTSTLRKFIHITSHLATCKLECKGIKKTKNEDQSSTLIPVFTNLKKLVVFLESFIACSYIENSNEDSQFPKGQKLVQISHAAGDMLHNQTYLLEFWQQEQRFLFGVF